MGILQLETQTYEEAKKQTIERYIAMGLECLRDRDYTRGRSHFLNENLVKKLGLEFNIIHSTVHEVPNSKIEELILHNLKVDRKYHFQKDEINVVDIMTVDRRFRYRGKLPSYEEALTTRTYDMAKTYERPEVLISPHLQYELMLMNAEGWLYTLRYLNYDKPIAGFKNSKIDTAAYLAEHGVQLTDTFVQGDR
ncbi:MAG: hypothetical protein M3R72_05995 [Bacteroidota bacterium]|nr:hypothetical protein [Bacteroidota bacterium]